MIAHINEYLCEQGTTLAEQVHRFREEPVERMREVAVTTAGNIKALKAPVRAFAHSGVKLATVSQNTVQNLIELESEVITSALTAVAMRFERAARAENVVELEQAGSDSVVPRLIAPSTEGALPWLQCRGCVARAP